MTCTLPLAEDIRLSEHAFQRWTERAWPASYETVRAYILGHAGRRLWIRMGASKITMPADGVALVIADRAIVTVKTLEKRPKRRHPRKWQFEEE